MKKHILLLILTWAAVVCLSLSKAKGQQYPVDCRVMVPPPYSGKFTDYAHTPGKLRVQLLLRDLSKPELEVSLRIRLKSPVGLVIENPAGFMYTNPVRLTPGVVRTLSGPELAENFDASALETRGIDLLDLLMGGYLPTGPYEWEVIAYEHYRDRQVSNVGSALMMFSSNLPPMLNLPGEGSILPTTQPQNVMFSWTPRHMPGTALGLVSYTLTLYELPDGIDDPQDYVLNSGIPYRIIETTQTSYSYGPAEVPLTPGKRYAWQVRVQADAGFENQGYSTIGTFRYGTPPCEAPVNLTAEEDGGSVWFSWDAVEGAVSYTLSIDGKEHTLSKPPYLLQGAEAGHTYSYRVQTVCSGGSRSPVSALHTLTIPGDEPKAEQAWYSDPELTFESDSYYGTEETYLDEEDYEEPALEVNLDDILNTPVNVFIPAEGTEPSGELPPSLPVLPPDATVEHLQEAVKSKKPTCAGIQAFYSCGSHDAVPQYTGPIISVSAGDDVAMNSMLLSIVSIDGSGNGEGLIKVPMMDRVKLGVSLSGIQVAEGGCIVAGRAELSGVDAAILNDKQREELAKIYAEFNKAIDLAVANAELIANVYNGFMDVVSGISQKATALASKIGGGGKASVSEVKELQTLTSAATDQMQASLNAMRVAYGDKINQERAAILEKMIADNRANSAALESSNPAEVEAASQALAATNPAEVEKTIKSLGSLQVEYNGKLYGDGKTLKMNPESLEGIIQGQSDIPLSCGFFLKNGISGEAISWELKTSSGATLPLEAPLRISATSNSEYLGIKWPDGQAKLTLTATSGSRKVTLNLEKPVWNLSDLQVADGNRIAKAGEILYIVKAPAKDEKATVSWKSDVEPSILKNYFYVDGKNPTGNFSSNKITYNFSNSPNTTTYRMNALGYDKTVKVQVVEKYDNQIDYTQKLSGIGEVFDMVNYVSKKVGTLIPCEIHLPKINQMISDKTFNVGYNMTNEEEKDRHISEKEVTSFKLISPKIAGIKCEKNLGVKFWIIDLNVGGVFFDFNLGSNINFSHETKKIVETKVVSKRKFLQGGLEVGLDVGAKLGNVWDVNGIKVGVVGKVAVNASAGGRFEYPYEGNSEEAGLYAYVNPVKLKITGEAKAGIYSKELSWDYLLIDTKFESSAGVYNFNKKTLEIRKR